MAAGNGKIANLPAMIRDELNQRLNNGEPGNKLVEWLNAHPDVRKVLDERFDARPISEQNLSEWRNHGYQQWLTLHTILQESEAASETAEHLAKSGVNAERLLLILTARYAELIQRWNLTATDQLNYKMGVFRALTDAVLALRRAELQTVRLQIARERLELLRERQRDKSDSSSSSPASSSPDSSTETTSQSRPVDPIVIGPHGAMGVSQGLGSGFDISPSGPANQTSPESRRVVVTQSESDPRKASLNATESILGCRAATAVVRPQSPPPSSWQEAGDKADAASQDVDTALGAFVQPASVASPSANSPDASATSSIGSSQPAARAAVPSRPSPRTGGLPSTSSPRNPLGLL